MNELEAVGAEAVARGPDGSGPGASRADQPWLYSLLIAPSATLMNGVIQGGVLAYILSQHGVGSKERSDLIDWMALPTSIYFLWSPLTDFFVKRRTWLLIGGLAGGVLMALALARTNLRATSTLVMMFLAACASQLVVSSCGGMLGTIGAEKARRTAGSFYQAGGLAFGALAALVLIPLSDSGKHGILGLAAGAMIALPALSAFAAPRQESTSTESYAERLREMRREFVQTFWRWEAIPYTLTLGFPIASGAAVSLITAVAKAYGVNGTHVAWMNGFGGAVLMGAGALAAALIPATTRAPVAYLVIGLVNAMTLGITWLGPMEPSSYYVAVTLYLFTTGMGYAYFTAVLLEFLGQSGESGSGRYSIINSLGNVPVLYMIKVDGWGGEKWGPRGLSGAEAVVSSVGAVLLLAYFLTRGRRTAPAVMKS